MSKVRVGHFEGDGGDIFLPLGFIPDYFRLCNIDHGLSFAAVEMHDWFERMEDNESGGSQEGWVLSASNLGYVTLHPNGQGITAYDTGTQFPASGYDAGELKEWKASEAVDVRTGTTAGSYAKGTVGALDDTGAVVDRDAIFENVGSNNGNTDSSEPTWPSAIGGLVVDNTAIWKKVNTALFRGGYQGVGIAAEICDDSQEFYYLAIKADDSVDHGDTVDWPSGIDNKWI